ncbi:hypothetical protein [Pseudomonas sp. F1002]|uniref:hypothetical protein n=1 Tax=Pseudomonas sp. F1002 TaxID=2738821 RepID=UPI003527EE3C
MSPFKATAMQTGRARYRRNYSSVPTNVKVIWNLSSAEAQYFESWFEEVLVSGSQWFECELRSPQGLQPYKAHFLEMYDGPDLFGVDRWTISATLQLWERPILTGGWAVYAPQYILGMNIFDIAMNIDWPRFVESGEPLLTEAGENIITESGEEILV